MYFVEESVLFLIYSTTPLKSEEGLQVNIDTILHLQREDAKRNVKLPEQGPKVTCV